jgi:hypothetical protein
MTSNYDSTAPLRLSRPGALMRSLGPSAALFAALGCSSGNGDGQTPGSQSNQNQFVPQHPNCGNNVLDADEPCDGTQFRYQVTCAFATNNGLTAGAVTCNSQCTLDSSTCLPGPPVGGNGAGGYSSMGGAATSSGGFLSMGGLPGMGGAAVAGFPGNGGFPGAGGAPGAGGFSTAGGAPSTGGDVGSGGTVSTGGVSTSTGGTPITTVGDPKIPPTPSDCPTLATGNVTIQGITVQLWVGQKRTDVKAPVMFYWHGTGSHSGEAGLLGGAVQEIQSLGGIIASPENSLATGQTTGNNVWYIDDFKISDYILGCAIQQLNVDTHQIYAAGCSAGGLQAGAMVFSRSSYLAAAMPNSGGSLAGGTQFQDSHIPSVITAHGDSNDFSGLFATASTNECNAVKNAGGIAVDCDHGGSHCGAPSDLVAAQWQFLKDHPFGVKPDPYAGGLPASFPTYCKQF